MNKIYLIIAVYCFPMVGAERRRGFFASSSRSVSSLHRYDDQKYDNSRTSFTPFCRLSLSRESWGSLEDDNSDDALYASSEVGQMPTYSVREREGMKSWSVSDDDWSNNNDNNNLHIQINSGNDVADEKELYIVQPVSALRRFGKKNENESTTTASATFADNDDDEDFIVGITSPLVPESVWEKEIDGSEFEDPVAVDKLTRSGLLMTTQEGSNNPWMEWKASKATEKTLQEENGNIMTALDKDNILVYIGKVKESKENEEENGYFGSNLPMIKSKSILPMSAEEMANLLMDSSKVQIYNKLSVGRTDIKVFNNDENTKIVRNLTKPPIAKSNMVSVTFMHARPLSEEDHDMLMSTPTKKTEGYIVVSRAVPGAADGESADLPRNDILLGVNLLQDLGPNECMMTAVTHVFSPSLPTMMAKKLGVSSAINFVKDIRAVRQPVAAN